MKNFSNSWETISVEDNTQMRMFAARPEHPTAGVIVLPEVFGINAYMQNITLRIASLGYLAVAPELFHRTAEPGFTVDYKDMETAKSHMNKLTNKGLEDDMAAAHAWLQKDENVGDNIAAVGFCLGGKCAFMANAKLTLKAAVSFYGTGIHALLTEYASEQNAPLLLLWGGQDKNADQQKRNDVNNALDERGKIYRQMVFSDAGHAFFNNDRDTFKAEASQEAWALLAQFLANHLKH